MTSVNSSMSHRGRQFLFFPAAFVLQGQIEVLDIMKITQNDISPVTIVAKSSCVIQINLVWTPV